MYDFNARDSLRRSSGLSEEDVAFVRRTGGTVGWSALLEKTSEEDQYYSPQDDLEQDEGDEVEDEAIVVDEPDTTAAEEDSAPPPPEYVACHHRRIPTPPLSRRSHCFHLCRSRIGLR